MIFFYNIALLIASFLLVRLVDKRNLFSLWLQPIAQRTRELRAGLAFTALLCGLVQVFLAYQADTRWVLAPGGLSMGRVLALLSFDLNSVLFEELIFRGALLYFLLHRGRRFVAVVTSAIAFGVYHWFTTGVLGNPLGMTLVFVTTGLMGYVFALAYARSGSIVLPFGLHLGWNAVNHLIFSNGPLGNGLLRMEHAPELAGNYALLSFGIYLLVGGVLLLGLPWLTSTVEKR